MKLQINKNNLIEHLPMINEEISDGKEYDFEIKPHRERRSLDANAYFWTLCDKLSEVLRIPKSEIYRGYIREIGGVSSIVCCPKKATETFCKNWERQGMGWQTEVNESKLEGCNNVTVYYGSSVFDSRQMSMLIDMVCQDCIEQNIPIESQERLDQMVKEWCAK